MRKLIAGAVMAIFAAVAVPSVALAQDKEKKAPAKKTAVKAKKAVKEEDEAPAKKEPVKKEAAKKTVKKAPKKAAPPKEE